MSKTHDQLSGDPSGVGEARTIGDEQRHHSGTSLQEWMNAHTPSDKLLYKEGFYGQAMFVRDRIVPLVAAGLRYSQVEGICTVISEHTSKSVRLPVYCIRRPDLGLTVVLRNNFHDWKMSVSCDSPIEAELSDLFHTTPPLDPDYTGDPVDAIYFEGFPRELVYGYYEGNHKQWSAEINSDEELYTALHLIMRALSQKKPKEWVTKETHKPERDFVLT